MSWVGIGAEDIGKTLFIYTTEAGKTNQID